MRAAIYCRVSGIDDDREASLTSQAEAATKLAKESGFETCETDVYRDRFTGSELHARPSLSRLRDAVQEGRYQAVFVYALDRLARDTNHQAILCQEWKTKGVVLRSITEPNVDETAVGQLLRNVYGFVAEIEREKILDRTQRGTQKILEQGVPLCSGVARYGYVYDKESRCREIDDNEAEVVHRIFVMASEGLSTRKIAKKLNDEGIPSPGAKRGRSYEDGRICVWTKSTVTAILQDESYVGDPMKVGKTRVTGERKGNGRSEVKHRKRESWTALKDPTPIIVDRELFDRAQAAKGTRKAYARSQNERVPRLLRGMIFCGRCGRTMTTQSTSKWKKEDGRYEFYLCMAGKGDRPDDLPCGNGRTQIEQVDAVVWAKVAELVSQPEVLESMLRRAIESHEETDFDREIVALEEAVGRSTKSIKRLIDKLASEDDDAIVPILDEKIASEKAKLIRNREALGELQAQRAAITDKDGAVSRFREIIERAQAALHDGLSLDQQRNLMEALGVRVYVERTEVRLQLQVTPTDFLSGTGSSRA